MVDLKGRDILQIRDMTREEIEYILDAAAKMEYIVQNHTGTDLLKDKILAYCFYQPSTRTRLSFESAMLRLGGRTLGFADPRVTRFAEYGETMKDQAKMIEGYCDVVVVRHFEDEGCTEFAKWCKQPVISGGSGANEHPTQAMLDLYTMRKWQGRIDGLKVLISGPMNIRSAHSLSFALAMFNDVKLYQQYPDQWAPRNWVIEVWKKLGLDYERVTYIRDVLDEVDVIYMNGLSTESLEPYQLKGAKDNLIVMHPLPRGNLWAKHGGALRLCMTDLPVAVDDTNYCKYWDQAQNGVYVRMALLALVFGKTPDEF